MRPQRLQFTFTDPDDVAAYGAGPWVWDEPALARLRGREQIDLEELVDMPLIKVMRGLREEKTLHQMAAMWLTLHRAGQTVAWADFNPITLAVEWGVAPEVPLDSGAATPDSSSEPSTESATS